MTNHKLYLDKVFSISNGQTQKFRIVLHQKSKLRILRSRFIRIYTIGKYLVFLIEEANIFVAFTSLQVYPKEYQNHISILQAFYFLSFDRKGL